MPKQGAGFRPITGGRQEDPNEQFAERADREREHRVRADGDEEGRAQPWIRSLDLARAAKDPRNRPLTSVAANISPPIVSEKTAKARRAWPDTIASGTAPGP